VRVRNREVAGGQAALDETLTFLHIPSHIGSPRPENITKKFGEPIIGELARRDGKPSAEGMPNYYLVDPIEFNAKSTRGFCEVQLTDFWKV